MIDLTHLIEENMPVFPGTEGPSLENTNTIEADGFAEKELTFFSHTGTHMDAPAHMLINGKTLDAYSISDFFGAAVLVDLTSPGLDYVGVETLRPVEALLQKSKFLVLKTGWSRFWGQPEYFENFPALTPEAAEWAVETGIKGVGIDAISIDRITDYQFPVHHVLFRAGLFVIENLAGLERLSTSFQMGCFPLKIRQADGAPARVVAWEI